MVKRLLFILMLFVASQAKAQTREMYPADRCNRVFMSSLSSGITYCVSYSLLKQTNVKKPHLYPTLVTLGTNIALGALAYAVDNSGPINKRQNVTAWFSGSIVTVTLLRIGIN